MPNIVRRLQSGGRCKVKRWISGAGGSFPAAGVAVPVAQDRCPSYRMPTAIVLMVNYCCAARL